MELQPPKTFRLPKAGNRPEECEDDSWYNYQLGKSRLVDTATIALSDGASESAFAKEWAHILVQGFVDSPLDPSRLDQSVLQNWLEDRTGQWDRVVPWDRIPWHGEAKARAGALATLLGLSIEPNGSRPLSWKAAAVGDSCLFVVREDDMALSFPLEHAVQFNNAPSLICSSSGNNRGLLEAVRWTQGECAQGDLFILASDALACWILESYAAREKPWAQLDALESQEVWGDWVQMQRQEHSLKNDDTTIVIIRVE